MESPYPNRKARFGAFEADLRSGELRKHGIRLKLQDQPFHVLELLLQHPGEVVTREELRQKLWPGDTFVDFDTGLNSAVKKLRDVLGDSTEEPRYIETVPRHGYRFIAAVENGAGHAPLTVEPQVAAVLPSRPAAQIGEAAPAPVNSAAISNSGAPPRRHWLVLAGGLALALIGMAYATHRWRAAVVAQPKIRSLAVLPLKNMTGDPAQEYFADGMTDALIGRLSSIHNLRVISRTSVMRFKNPQISVPDIAKALQVDAIVEGSVMRDGNRIRVTAQMIRASTDEHFWSETYDRELQDVFTLQSELAQSIAEKVEATATGTEHDRLMAARPVAPEVYESYSKGEFALNKSSSQAELEASIPYFEDAIKRDPNFAPAYVGLANAYSNLGTVFIGGPPQETRAKVVSAAEKALEVDPDLAEAHVLLADVKQKQWQWAAAEAEYRRALELDPNSAPAYEGLGLWLVCQGRASEAVAAAERGRELDPLGVSFEDFGWTLFQTRHYDQAIRELRAALVSRPDDFGALMDLGFVLIANDQPEDAIPVLEKAVALSQRSPGALGILIRAYAHAGRRSDALQMLAELKRRRNAGYAPAGALVNAYLGLGDNEEAFVWLEQAYKEQSNMLQFVKVHPYFDPIRADPRLASLVRRVGLE
jgi:TolB-like protein/DNA-binding winged helix-turn-helix (wHTH) protein/Tfp pilus assembly protein PilF